MSLELEGSINLDRVPTRRWVSIIAVVIPVGAFVLLAALFVRAYVAPPTVSIPSPTTVAAAPSPLSIPRRAAVSAPLPPMGEPAAARQMSASASNLPMLATLAAAPPTRPSEGPAQAIPAKVTSAYVAPAQDAAPPAAAAAPPVKAAEPPPPVENHEAAAPAVAPVPLPRTKPHHPVAFASRAIPLPRPKPAEEAPEPDLPAFDRHAIN
jgi:hypothetical protein